jgi:hypothetical protein
MELETFDNVVHEQQKQKAPVADFVPAALGGRHKLFKFG